MYNPKAISVKAKGPQHAELIGIYRALVYVNKYAGKNKNVVVYCDSAFAIDICNNRSHGNREYIVKISEKIEEIKKSFNSVSFVKADAKSSKQVDKLSKTARKRREGQLQERMRKRREQLTVNFQKAESIQIVDENGSYYAISARDGSSRYAVSLDPVHCDCPSFSVRWKKVHPAGAYKHRIPCKHICALSIHLSKKEELWKKVMKE